MVDCAAMHVKRVRQEFAYRRPFAGRVHEISITGLEKQFIGLAASPRVSPEE